MRRVSFIVLGLAEPKGSTRLVPHCRFPRLVNSFVELLRIVSITSDNRELSQWAGAVRSGARQSGGELIETGPVQVSLHFSLPRPQRLQTKRWRMLSLWHTTRPDLDKLSRAVKDALSGVLYTDDGQVARLLTEKTYVDFEEHPGVHVTVEELKVSR